MTKGIVIGCDQTQEWMLRWWWAHYSRHNCYPVAFIDFGMSQEAQKWCKAKGHWISLDAPKNFVFPKSLIAPDLIASWEKVNGKELWKRREKWFYKPFALRQTPFDETIWIDLDCEITAPLTPLFQKIHTHSKMALALERSVRRNPDPSGAGQDELFIQEAEGDVKSPASLNRRRTPSTEEEVYNSGVIAYHRTSPLLDHWIDLTLRHNDRFLGDQDVLTFIINNENIEVTELPSKYNWVVHDGINFEAIILHWAGQWGKDVIRRQCHSIV
ncbi:MAG TPA: hypothetical protein VHK67_03080 [Rhabdochlamydiaceae bacterium]|jgi:hypothetical protein|nr:hypothetical protein [Rhabdochlamydiaceae bacterium]